MIRASLFLLLASAFVQLNEPTMDQYVTKDQLSSALSTKMSYPTGKPWQYIDGQGNLKDMPLPRPSYYPPAEK